MTNQRFAVSTFFFINGVILASWASRLPKIQDEFGIENKGIGMLLLAHAIGAFIAMPTTGWLITKYGSRWITTASGFIFPIFFLLIPLMPNYLLLFFPFFLLGTSNGIMDVAMNAQAVSVEQAYEKPIMTMFHALFSIGMVAGGIIGTFYTKAESGLLTHFLAIALFSLIAFMFSAKYLYPDSKSDEKNEAIIAWPKGPVIGLGIIAFCCMMGEGAMTDWSAIYMKDIMSSSKDFQVFGLTAFAAMMTVGRLFGDKGRTSFGDRKMMINGAILSLIGMFFILTTINAFIVIMGFGLVGLGLSNIVPIVYSLAGTTPGLSPGVGIAMATTIGYTGFMFGPPIIGLLADFYNLQIGLYFMAILFLLMLVLVIRHHTNSNT